MQIRKSTRADQAKTNGVHYTPPELAQFLAQVTVAHLSDSPGNLRVLDPACGDGILLRAFTEALPSHNRKRLILTGFETDERAVQRARKLLSGCHLAEVVLKQQDFLLLEGVEAFVFCLS